MEMPGACRTWPTARALLPRPRRLDSAIHISPGRTIHFLRNTYILPLAPDFVHANQYLRGGERYFVSICTVVGVSTEGDGAPSDGPHTEAGLDRWDTP